MSKWFGRKPKPEKKDKAKPPKNDPVLVGVQHRRQSSSSEGGFENGRPTSSPSSNEQYPTSSSPYPNVTKESPIALRRTPKRDPSGASVKESVKKFEALSATPTPTHEPVRRASNVSPEKYNTERRSTPSYEFYGSNNRRSSSSQSTPRHNSKSDHLKDLGPSLDLLSDSLNSMKLEVGREKEFSGVYLPLPPLQTSSVRHRNVTAEKSTQFGGFGFNLRKSFQPDLENPDKPLLVHLVEPRPNYVGPLMTGDRILEVNGENVAHAPHERVVDLIKASGDQVQFIVASVPELMELNERGVFDDAKAHLSTRKGARSGAGTLRKKAAQRRDSMAFKVRQ